MQILHFGLWYNVSTNQKLKPTRIVSGPFRTGVDSSVGMALNANKVVTYL